MKIELTSDARLWLRKWSTWWAFISASAGAAATAGFGAYVLMPERAQNLMPDWLLVVLGGVAVASAIMVPVATSLCQSSLKKDL